MTRDSLRAARKRNRRHGPDFRYLAHVLPLMPAFIARYPRIRPEWHFESRPADLIAEGYDAAMGGGFELAPDVVSRTLAPARVVAVASPTYVAARTPPSDSAGLAAFDGTAMLSTRTGRGTSGTLPDAAASA